jgi:mannose-6-phosphate isomerase-like protein (cupin superfamily)
MHARKESLSAEVFMDGYESRMAELDDYAGYFESIAAGTDFSPYYESCEVPHWGYVFKGRLRFVYTDGHQEEVTAGELYYVPPGHTFEVLEDSETVEFSPKAPLEAHFALVTASMETMTQERG